MPALDELVLTEPRGPGDGGIATSRTLREDIHACTDGLHWVAYSGRPERVYDVTEWAAYAAVDGAIIARGTVAGVQVDDRTETATLDVEPPERVFPTTSRAEP